MCWYVFVYSLILPDAHYKSDDSVQDLHGYKFSETRGDKFQAVTGAH